MSTGADGVLTAVWRPEVAAVSLVVDGAGWGSGVARNLIPNPSFEVGVAGVTAGAGATVARFSTARPERVGDYLLGVSVAGVTAPAWARQIVPVSGVDGQWVAFSALVGRSSGVSHARIIARCHDAGGASLGEIISPYLTLRNQNLDRLTVSRQIPVGTASIQCFVWLYGAASSATPPQDGTILTDAWQAVIASTEADALAQVAEYFDGSTPSTDRTTYTWDSTPHASPSTRTSAPITHITIHRLVAGQPDTPVRGADHVPAIDGYWTGTDHEQPLRSTVTYQATGHTATGAQVLSSTVTVSTDGVAHGIWLKAAGHPNLTTRLGLVERGARSSVTQGGVYNIAGGRGIAVAAAAGREGDTLSLRLRAESTAELTAALTLLDEHRIVLIQAVGTVRPLPDAWWYVSAVEDALVSQADRTDLWDVTLNLTRTGIPAGGGQGVIGWSWDDVEATYATWNDVEAAYATWFDLERGA